MKILLACFLTVILGGSTISKKSLAPGLLLTFDDRNMYNWEKQIPLFAKYNAHVTFFIDHFDELTPDQIKALQNLKDAGHTIGCHGLRHLKAVDYCEKYGTEKYISDEIAPAIKIMKEKGFPPDCFAYPNSNNDELTDRILLKYFRHLRTGCRVENEIMKTEKAFVKVNEVKGQGCLNGISFHPKLKTDDLVIQAKRALDRIKSNGELLVLYAHDIRNENEKGPKNFITIDALEEILSYAKSNHIKLYSYDEIP